MPKKTAQGAIAFNGSLAGTTGVVAVGGATVCAMAGPPREFASHLGGALDDVYGSDLRGVQRAGASRSQWRDRAGFPTGFRPDVIVIGPTVPRGGYMAKTAPPGVIFLSHQVAGPRGRCVNGAPGHGGRREASAAGPARVRADAG